MAYKTRIYLSLAVLAAGLILLAQGLYRGSLQETALNELRHDGFRQLALIEGILQGNGALAPDRLQSRLIELSKTLNARLTFIGADGRVLADSGETLESIRKMDSHAGRPEIRQAENEGQGSSLRYSHTQHIEFFYLATRTELPDLGSGFLRLAKPKSHIERAYASNGFRLGILLGAGCLATLLLGWLLNRRLRREVSSIGEAAESIGSGDQTTRIDFLPLREFVPLVRSINRLSKTTQKDYQTIKARRNELEAILNGMQEGVMVLDATGGVIKTNEAAERIFQVSFDSTGRKPIELLRCPELQSAVEEMLASRSQESTRLLVSLPDQRHFDVTVIPMFLTSTERPEMIVVLHDVSELKRLEQVRKDFVANISHELRTPLTSIKGYTETLLSGTVPDSQTLTSFMKVIQKNVNTMNHLLENLLQLARLESDQYRNGAEPVDAKTTFSVAWEVCAPMAADKGISLDNKLPEKDIYVLARHEQLVRVWINLLDNALKYSQQEGTIRISATENDGHWIFSIQDDGPGIPPKDQDRIFERFYRVDAASAGRDIPGTGLGLAICKHILQRHQGSIWVTSPVPETLQGTIFFFSLPKPHNDRT